MSDGGGTERRGGTAELEALVAARRRFVIPALVFFTVFYGGFLVCVAYARGFMDTAVIGAFTWAYLWALALIVMTWTIALLYLRYSERTLSPLAERALEAGAAGPRDGR